MRCAASVLLLGTSACFRLTFPECNGTRGENGNASFRYDRFDDCALGSVAVAAGGAHTDILVHSGDMIAEADTIDPDILQVTSPPSFDSKRDVALVPVLSGRPGATRLRILSKEGREIDRVMIRVAPTAEIDVERSWNGNDFSMVASSTVCVHAATIGSLGEDLVGIGAIAFRASGVLADTSRRLAYADAAYVAANHPGEGALVLSAVDATRTIAVHSIARDQIDFALQSPIPTNLRVGQVSGFRYVLTVNAGTQVFGSCGFHSSRPDILAVTDPAFVGFPDADCFRPELTQTALTAKAPGKAIISCAIGRGTVTATVTVAP